IDPIEIDAVKPRVDDALEITVFAAEDDFLPAFVPIAYAVVPAPLRVFAAEPAWGEHTEDPAPVPFPIVAICLRFPDRQIGEHDTSLAVGLDPNLVDLFRR